MKGGAEIGPTVAKHLSIQPPLPGRINGHLGQCQEEVDEVSRLRGATDGMCVNQEVQETVKPEPKKEVL